MRYARRLFVLFGLLALTGGAGADAPAPAFAPTPNAMPAAARALADWPWREYWTGIVFNGGKIGFSHLAVTPAGANGEHVIRSKAALRFRFLGLDKSIRLHSEDRVGPDLGLRSFVYDYRMDGHDLRITGRVDGPRLITEVETGGARERREHRLAGPVYPASAINLLPLHYGLAVGRRRAFTVYDGETRQLAAVTQEVLAREPAPAFKRPAYRIRTTMYGQEVTTWLSPEGLPLRESSLGGALIAGLETEAEAKESLASAALNKHEGLLEFSQVPTDTPIPRPRAARRLRLALAGADPGALPPSDARQRCARRDVEIACDIGPAAARGALAPGERERYLTPSLAAPAGDPRIAGLAREIAADRSGRAAVGALVDWIRHNIGRAAVDAFTALDVLRTRQAECQGHSFLYAALARAQGLPTRVVNGLVYSEEHGAFLFHTWTETWLDGQWLAVDPTFGQIGVDATHLKLLEGENPAELMPLLGYLGRTRARVLEID